MGLLRRRASKDAVSEIPVVDRRGPLTETRGDRHALAVDAGLGDISTAAVFAGTLVALATTAIMLGAMASITRAVAGGTSSPRSAATWGIGAGILTVFSVWAGYTFGGYTTGRMARRAGATNGFLVFFTSLLAGLVGLALFVQRGNAASVGRFLHDAGIRTTGSWLTVGAVTGIGSLAIMIVTSILGGAMGERWHTAFVERAVATRAESDEVVDVRDRKIAAEPSREVRARKDEVVSHDVTPADEEATSVAARDDVLPQGRR